MFFKRKVQSETQTMAENTDLMLAINKSMKSRGVTATSVEKAIRWVQDDKLKEIVEDCSKTNQERIKSWFELILRKLTIW